MKLVRYRDSEDKIRLGEMIDDIVYSLSPDVTIADVMSQPNLTIQRGEAVAYQKLLPPVEPSKILAIGRNYAEHAAELANEVPTKPLIFSKFPTSVIGCNDPVQWRSSITKTVDWEGELAVVIGKTAQNVSEDEAYDYIFGYTIANDVSARDLQDSEKQWTRAKAMDTFCPLGPCLVTRDDIPDPHQLTIKTEVNDEVMQHSTTDLMIFKIPFLVAYLSQTFTLQPGDLILTGTPAGVGKGMKPPRFLKSRDVVCVTIEPIGTLMNPCHILD